jgi:hypothetical protein
MKRGRHRGTLLNGDDSIRPSSSGDAGKDSDTVTNSLNPGRPDEDSRHRHVAAYRHIEV